MPSKKTISNTFNVTTIEDGEDAAIVYASPDSIVVQCNSSGGVKAAVQKQIALTMKVGSSTFQNFSKVNIGTLPTGVTVQRDGSNTVMVSIGTTATSSGLAAGFNMTVYAYNGTEEFHAPIHISIIGAMQGENAFAIDLENEMTGIVVDEDGDTEQAVSLHTEVRAFYGTQNVIGQCSVAVASSDVNVTAQYNSSTHEVDVSIAANTHLSNTTTITITVTHPTYAASGISTEYIISAVRKGTNAYLHELLPTLSEVSFKRNSDGSLTPPSRAIGLNVKVTDGDIPTLQTVAGSGLTVRWGTSMPTIVTDGAAWGSGTDTGISWNDNGDMVVANTTNVNNICIAAFNSNGTLVDRETIPVIMDGKHGESAPYYFQEWYAWSNVASTNSVSTSPFGNNTEPNPAWQTAIPENTGALAYLWKKSIRYVWNSSTRQYAAENAQYFRMNGENGTSIKTKGTVSYVANSTNALPAAADNIGQYAIVQGETVLLKAQGVAQGVYAWAGTGQSQVQDGDAYVCAKDSTVDLNGSGTAVNVKNHLIQYNHEAGKWIDLGQFKGDNGTTYYTHIAWATNVTYDSSTPPQLVVEGFVTSKPIDDTTHNWMGTYVDTNSGQDPNNALLYTWSFTKGKDGDDAVTAVAYPDKIVVRCNSDGSVKSAVTKNVTFAVKVGGSSYNPLTITPPQHLPTGVTVTQRSQTDVEINIATTATATGISGGITFSLTATDGTNSYQASVLIALIPSVDGSTGERGKTGRFFYYGGDWNSSDSTTEFDVTDASVPFFSKAGSSSDKNFVFDPDNPPASGKMTMAQMAAATMSQGVINWNTKPWVPMTEINKYLITEAIFVEGFAKFGSAIISGDWMLSCYGVIYDTNDNAHVIDDTNSWTSGGTTYTYNNAYNLFDAAYPNRSKENALNFAPYYCVDMLSGTTYMYNAFLKGTIEAQSGHIGGLVINQSSIVSSNGNFSLSSDGSIRIGAITGNRFVLSADSSGSKIIGTNRNNTQMLSLGWNGENSPLLVLGNSSNGAGISGDSIWTRQGTDQNNFSYLHTICGTEYATAIFQTSNTYGSGRNGTMEIGIDSGTAVLRAIGNRNSVWPNVNASPYRPLTDYDVGRAYALSFADLENILNDGDYSNYYSHFALLMVRTS